MKNNKGFTLVEMVVTTAIISILFSVLSVNVTALSRGLSQMECDAYSRQIYVTAQENVTKLKCSGSDILKNGHKYSYTIDGYLGDDLYYIYSTDEDAKYFYDSTGNATPGNWVIEYDALLGHVKGVFWVEESLDTYTATESDLVLEAYSQEERLAFYDEHGYHISYYGDVNADGIVAYYETKATQEAQEEPEEDPDEINDKLDLTGTGFYYWEVYEDGSWGTYCIYDFDTNTAHCKDCLQEKVVIRDGYGVGVEKDCDKHLYMNRKGSNLLLYWFSDYGMSTIGFAELETAKGYLYTFPKEWSDEVEDSIVGYFYARLGFWVFDRPVVAPWDFRHPITIFTNMRFAKNGLVVSRGEDVPSIADYEITQTLYVRSARHLYDLSLYYPKFALRTGGLQVIQDTDIDYLKYDWRACSVITNSAPKQIPIGSGAFVSLENHDSFMMNYDGTGHYINGLNIKAHSLYSGLFSKVKNSIYWIHGHPIDSGVIENVNITYIVQEKALYTGSICGYLGKKTRISNCTTTGSQLVGYKDRTAIIE